MFTNKIKVRKRINHKLQFLQNSFGTASFPVILKCTLLVSIFNDQTNEAVSSLRA